MKPQTPDIATATTTAIAALTALQASDGSFSDCKQSVMQHSLILEALCASPEAKQRAGDMPDKLAGWLWKQQQADGSFGRAGEQSLATTCTALNALRTHQPARLTGTVLGQLARLLVVAESQVGGPYRNATGQADLSTNAATGRLIASLAQPLPQVQAYLDDWTEHCEQLSPVELLRLVQSCSHSQHGALSRRLKSTYHGLPLSASQAAYLTLTLQVLGALVPSHVIHYLLATQKTTGTWPTRSSDMPRSLVTALALQALCQAQPAATHPYHTPRAEANPPTRRAQATAIYHAAAAHFARFDPALTQEATALLKIMQAADQDDEIILLAAYFAEGLHHKPVSLSDDFFAAVGLANLYNWMAFTLYDDFYDGDARPITLPLANACLHHSLRLFREALPEHRAFQALVDETFDRLDSANAWEISSARLVHQTKPQPHTLVPPLPDYGDLAGLADRSFSHILPVLAVLAAQGVALDSAATQAVQRVGRHYLACRQLNDDMHDWEEDLEAGCLTYTLAVTMRQAGIDAGDYPYDTLHARVRQRFWTASILTVCDKLEEQLTLGREALAQSNLMLPGNIFEKLFDSLERTVRHTRSEHGNAQGFIQSYRKK